MFITLPITIFLFIHRIADLSIAFATHTMPLSRFHRHASQFFAFASLILSRPLLFVARRLIGSLIHCFARRLDGSRIYALATRIYALALPSNHCHCTALRGASIPLLCKSLGRVSKPLHCFAVRWLAIDANATHWLAYLCLCLAVHTYYATALRGKSLLRVSMPLRSRALSGFAFA